MVALGDLELVRVKVMSVSGGAVGVLRRREEAIAESILGVGIVVEDAVAIRVGSRSRFGLIGREHDGGRVAPFIVQHNFLREAFP